MENDKDTQTYANDSATSSSTRTGSAQPRSGPVHYALFNKSGDEICRGNSVVELAALAKRMWPDQQQDDTGSGKGWDIHAVGMRPD